MFECDKCGLCCKNIRMNEAFASLDRGDGICKYLMDNMCSIYEQRPLLCQVDACYDLFYSTQMSRQEFYDKNHEICNELKVKDHVFKETK